MPELELTNLHASHHKQAVLNGITLTMSAGEIGCLLGPSGCGKTTLLRCIAGLHDLSKGKIVLNENTLSTPNNLVATEARKIGMVFQDYALFPHMTIYENIGFGIEKLTIKQKSERIKELLDLVGLPGIEQRYPHQLSGGQQQRIALARALAPKPNFLLLDEPFSGLDIELRESLAKEVRSILKQEGIGALMVTHNQNEAFAMADSIGVMNQGSLLQWDTPYSTYHSPKDPFIADFIGQGMLIQGDVCDCHGIHTSMGMFNSQVPTKMNVGDKVSLLVRPDDIVHDDDSEWQLEVVSRAFRGSHYLFTLKLQSGELVQCMSQSHHDHPVGSKIGVRLEMDHAITFPLQCEWKGQEIC